MRNTTLLLLISFLLFKCTRENAILVKSPDEKIQVYVFLDRGGIPAYSVFYKDMNIIRPSKLGLVRNDGDFSKGLRIVKVSESATIENQYDLFSGKRKNCYYKANKRSVFFENGNSAKLEIIFQVTNDGIAFCYRFPGLTKEEKYIYEEKTSFRFYKGTKAWLHPHRNAQTGWQKSQPSYEEHYYQSIDVGTSSPDEAGWSFPALYKYKDCWILVSESGLVTTYCGSRLSQHSPGGEYFIAFPQSGERTGENEAVRPQSSLPWKTPWRVIILGTLKNIVETTLITDMATPSVVKNKDFIQPGKASWSWALLKDSSVVFDVQKKFIDLAADMGWEYCLVDVGWDQRIGYEKMQELVDYAASKEVGLLLWYNAAGNWNTTPYTPRDKMLIPALRHREMARISQMGIKGIKVDFWGGDGQSMIKYYLDLIADAAHYKLLVNCHGTTIPRGWERTYPNLVTMESVRGFEFVTFEQMNADSAPTHCTILPFTRNAVGPMDFTPMCFSEIPNINRMTSNAFELALSVLFQSGIQHYAETPEGMAKQPGYVIDFLKKIPDTWEDIKFIDGFPGKYVVLARKGNNKWFVAGINGLDNEISLELDFSELPGLKKALVITDGETNRSFTSYDAIIENNKYNIKIKPHGGFVMLSE